MKDQAYLSFQQKLRSSNWFRAVWAFGGLYSLLLVYVAGIYLLAAGKLEILLVVMFAFVLARLVINPVIYAAYKKPRPYQRLGFVPINSPWLFSGLTQRFNSFPSDHAASFVSIAVALGFSIPVLGAVFGILAAYNGVSRIILGYHDEKDILAGWVVGIISALASIFWLFPALFTL